MDSSHNIEYAWQVNVWIYTKDLVVLHAKANG